ncbi:MAG TPA: cell division FtsA domain-containing protein [Haliangiales bacterium]|nr:cell division FtsA domain-containing protein [Haliangiales bacterium]
MKGLEFMNSPWLHVEIDQSSLKVLNGEGSFNFSLDRQENGRLSGLCRERLTRGLQGFLKRKRWQPRLRALCAIGARGVSLRRLTLPAANQDELHRLLLHQIENEFPLPPDQLAWGYRPVSPGPGPRNGATSSQELIVVALKRELLEEYSEIFSECGVKPLFTLAALARSRVCPQPGGSYLVLDIGQTHSELVSFENGGPSSLRILPWGGDNFTRSIEQQLEISRGEAEKLRVNLDPRTAFDGETGLKIQCALETALGSLSESLRSHWAGQKIYLTGKAARDLDIAPRLAKHLGDGAICERLKAVPGQDGFGAVRGFGQPDETETAQTPLIIQFNEDESGETLSRSAPWKWAALAILLALGLLASPYLEALALKPLLLRKITALKVERERLPAIDRELSFLQYVNNNQPPYLEALATVANAAPPGTRFDALSMNRRGDLSVRGAMRDSQQVVDFRSTLVSSGFFSTVVVEEQTPTPDRQKVIVRISAQWKAGASREFLPIAATLPEIEKPKIATQAGPGPPHEKQTSSPAPAVPVTLPGAPVTVPPGKELKP